MPARLLHRQQQTAYPNDPDLHGVCAGCLPEYCSHRQQKGCASCGNRLECEISAIARKTDKESCASSCLCFEVNCSLMLVDDYRASYGQALPGSLSYLLGREEWIEDLGSNLLGNA